MNGVTAGDVISTKMSPSFQWRIPKFHEMLRSVSSLDFIESPFFPHKNIYLGIYLELNALNLPGKLDRCLRLQIFQSINTRNKTHLFHSVILKRYDGSVYKSIEVERNDYAVELMPVSEFQEKKDDIAGKGDGVFILEFQPHDESVKYHSPLAECSELECLSKKFTDFYHQRINLRNEREYKAYRFVLYSTCPVFAAIMNADIAKKNSNWMSAKEFEPHRIDEFLFQLFSIEDKMLTNENVLGLYTVADRYRADFLKTDCVNYLKSNISVDMFCNIMELATNYYIPELIKFSKEYFIKNAKKIILSANWKYFLKENSELANELFLLVLPDN